MADREALVRGLEFVNGNLSREVERLREAVRKAEASSDYWREAWEEVIYTIGDMMRAAQDGNPPTANDLARLLVAPETEDAPPPKPRRKRTKAAHS